MNTATHFPRLLEAFFVDRLLRQRQASPHTIAAYRDSFCLLLRFAQQRLHKSPATLALTDLDAPFIGEFLDHLEQSRGNGARSRNARLAAIHSFFRDTALHDPGHSGLIQRVLAIPSKRYTRKTIEFLTRPEIEALLAAPNQHTWAGRRDCAFLLLAVETGLRLSEMTGLRCQDIVVGSSSAHVRCLGKGRKERSTPLSKEAAAMLRAWLRERHAAPTDPLFPNARGGLLSHDGVAYLLAKHLTVAQMQCSSLKGKRVSPHVLRHSAAMQLLQHGADPAIIALWLGHESLETTQMYLHADLQRKEQALAKVTPSNVTPGRYRPEDHLLAFLKSL